MSTIDQCPSTKGLKPTAPAQPSGHAYWRSVEEFSNSESFRPFLEREFPASASELTESSRRTFVKIMGASFALAGAATIPGCRRPDRKVMPYSRDVPEEIIPGRPLYYASAMPLLGGGAEGILVETHTGRPTHIQGNPLHPLNQGASSIWSTASVLDLYDPDRLKFPVYLNEHRGPLMATWDDFKDFWFRYAKTIDNGSGIAFIVDKQTSPSRDAMRDRVLARFPGATWVAWNAIETRGEVEGGKIAFGDPVRSHHDLSKASVVVSLDSDFTCHGPESIKNARLFARTRRVDTANAAMSRLYVAESYPTGTGSLADHRFRLAPTQISALAVAIAKGLMASQAPAGSGALKSAVADMTVPAVHDIPDAHIEAIVKDLINNRGRSVVMVGPSQPAEVHALVWAINTSIGAMGSLVWTSALPAELASDAGADFASLVKKIDRGEIKTLVCIGTNPVYDAPAGSDFAQKYKTIDTTICLSVDSTETAAASTWSLNGAHYLESWGDVVAWDGTASVIQPMIAPLYEPALSEIEMLALLTGEKEPEGYEIVTRTWSDRLGLSRDSVAFDKTWRRILHNGMQDGAASKPVAASPRYGAIADAVSGAKFANAPTESVLDVVFSPGMTLDGRHANNGWLQELPDVASKVTWNNPVYVSPATAKTLGVLPEGGMDPYTKQQLPQGRMAELSIGGRSMQVPVWIQPGMPDNTVRVVLGYGRGAACGHVGAGVGYNTYAVREAGQSAARGASLKRTSGTDTVASTQDHWSMESRTSIVRAIDKEWWDKHAKSGTIHKPDGIYGAAGGVATLNLAEQLGELSHTPPNVSIYQNPLNQSPRDPAVGSAYSKNPQWGMSIDLSSCTGCGVCTIACQSENNIPVVGEHEVAKGREMHWIRVDRYFTGDDMNNPDEMFMQPVACVHCENAPCETVCPVTATTHDPEGTNNMAYNRCIGTRYCANNCPYKVRRFNFFDWAQSKFNGGLDSDYVGKSMAEGSSERITFNENLIPPRLRAKVDEISKMQRNPNVTVRTRGVMEKCSFCVQRINRAKQEVKTRKIWTDREQVAPIPDGFFQTACQAACPTESIIFGDILDPSSRVVKAKESERTYMLLGYINTRPRTTHAMRVRNPNTAIRPLQEDPIGGHGGEGEGHGAGEHAFVDPVKRNHEEGYAMSLRVLSGVKA